LKENKLFWYELLFIWFKCYELEFEIMALVFLIWVVQYRGNNVFRFCRSCTICNEKGITNLCVSICHLKDKHATSFIVLTEKEELIRIRAGWSNGVQAVKYEDNKFFSVEF
jgi:hypothetical protein